MNEKNVNRVHWSFWVISGIALLWHIMGCINYLMQTNPETLAGYSEAARSLVEGRPAWATGAFAVAVFGGALGCILLLIKKSVAYYVFITSLLGVVVTNSHTFSVTVSTEIWVGSLLSLVVPVFLIWYTRQAERRSWLS